MVLQTEPITVIKNDHAGREILRYTGRILARDTTSITLEARFSRADVHTPYHTFRTGDRFIEWFYNDRWYNVFQMHDVDDDRLKGWYCNITRPATLSDGVIVADDLALDLFVSPGGVLSVLDEGEFAALPIDDTTRAGARQALRDLCDRVIARRAPFDLISP
ncbi:MAG: DUF402 domain-containing protein [Anaerolineae bacterium]|nr:DUF402 domain-containing protein [Anaerolineae bacterium]